MEFPKGIINKIVMIFNYHKIHIVKHTKILKKLGERMECPYCGGDCVRKSVVEMYLDMIEMFFKYRDENSDITYKKYPTVGEVGECKKTHERIWFCPYCKKPFKENYKLKEVTVQCPHCKETLCIPATNRTFC